uniref:Uncharacterized protein n=1 Tax=Chromera velia CCMP2878 TaxID=1169474 RepID=A0A0G4G4C9_9ALVE|eukprot:Cvel_20167.t1-p1 / transcript=Cvel_20167.t1 / gene=Cvel_20167 / organism=Chromera_velia_CCMP2878 / gene_product=hypothetical protein / transcript_product=hypothetical protein / location=Cvel_scaffold1792:431-973(-) / protein_length=181 / sequence_SO=supercontig / SO=protein_coding / is_pseudo=false
MSHNATGSNGKKEAFVFRAGYAKKIWSVQKGANVIQCQVKIQEAEGEGETICGCEYAAAATSSFQTHLINQHGLTITSDKHVQLLQERQEKWSEGAGGTKQPDVQTFFPTKDEAEAVVAPYAETHEKRIKYNMLTTDFLASAGWPHLTENEALRKLVKALDPRYDLPSVGKVQRLLLPTLK